MFRNYKNRPDECSQSTHPDCLLTRTVTILASHPRSELEGFIISIRGKISSLFGRQSVDLTHVASFLYLLSQAKIRLEKKVVTRVSSRDGLGPHSLVSILVTVTA